jgi:hypothetical protein
MGYDLISVFYDCVMNAHQLFWNIFFRELRL